MLAALAHYNRVIVFKFVFFPGCRMFQQNLTSVVDKAQKGPVKGITSLTEYVA